MKPRTEAGLVLVGFALSRLAYRGLGLRFDASPLDFYWQFVDPALLASAPVESILHLHAQPPLFNLYLAAVLALPPGWAGPVFAASFLACGAGLAVALARLQARLGVPPAVRLPVTLLFAASPAAVLYESHLFYTLPVAAALVTTALVLHRLVAGGRRRDAVALAALLVAVVLTRSLFHPAWGLAAAGLAVAAAPSRAARRRAAWAVAAVVLLAGGWAARGLAAFGEPGSSWLGMSLARTAVLPLTEEERLALAAAAPETSILRLPPFSEPEAYLDFVAVPPAGVAVLDRARKSTGAPNYHHAVYLPVSRLYGRAFAWVLTHRPQLYARGVARGAAIFFRDAADDRHLGEKAERVEPVAAWTRPLYLGQARRAAGRPGPGAVAWLHVALLPAALAWGFLRARRAWTGGDRAGAATLLFLAGTVAWIAAAGMLVELGENNRFRFLAEPLYLALAATLAAPRRPAAEGAGGLDKGPAVVAH